MRKWVDRYLSELANEDPSVRLLIADVGDFPVFISNHSDKFINVGVSESNCIGIAAGLAAAQLRVFVYGVSSFFLYRAFEQFKYAISYWEKPVTFIGIGFGWKYFNIGAGHFAPDDIALCRMLPSFKIRTPFTLSQLKEDIWTSSIKFPSYIRITASIVEDYPRLANFSGEHLIVSYGEMSKIAIAVWEELDSADYDITLLRDLDTIAIDALIDIARDKNVIVIEDQSEVGSLSSVLCNKGLKPTIRFMLPQFPCGIANSRQGLLKYYGLDKNSILSQIKKHEV